MNKIFFTGDACKTELLVVMLEKHDIAATEEFVSEELREHEDEYNRETRVLVPEADYERARRLFYEDDGKEF
ncbi:MAG: hypothetical protein ACI9VS_001489 [Candidatus Binatia bacterium]|jgi:hypothetical protein